LLLAYSLRLTMLVGAVIALIGWASSFLLAPETSGMTLAESSAADWSPRSEQPAGAGPDVDLPSGR
jgi:putative MFS transporter